MSRLLGLNQEQRFFEDEIADMLLLISPVPTRANISLDTLVSHIPLVFDGSANKLSPSMQEWEIIPTIEKATSINQVAQNSVQKKLIQREPTQEEKEGMSMVGFKLYNPTKTTFQDLEQRLV